MLGGLTLIGVPLLLMLSGSRLLQFLGKKKGLLLTL